jgi:preprotein translocase subunit YajC
MAAFGQLPIMLLIFVGIYFILFAPQQKKQKAWNAMLAAVKTGDRVTTSGGIRGTVIAVKDDCIVIKSAPDNVKLEIVKSAIAAVTTDDEPAKS